ncbi:MAG: SWIM zinc finger family protein [Acidimicrobiales bacterium]
MTRIRGAAGAGVAELAARVADGARLGRGRTIARRGLVGSLAVTAGTVTAEVEGSRPEPYEVTVACRPASAGVAADLAAVVADDELAARQFARGTVRPGLVDLAVSAAVELVPEPMDVSFSCTCPDWGEPCKHAVAVLLELATAVDDDGTVLLRWRGLDPSAATPPAPARSAPATITDLLSRLPPGVRRGTGAERTMQTPEPPADPVLEAFFTGSVPSSGPVLTATALGGAPGRGLDLGVGGSFVVEGVDAAAVLSEALGVIAEALESFS